MHRTLSKEMYSAQTYLNGVVRLLGDFPRGTRWESLLDLDEYADKTWLESLKAEIEDAHKGHESNLAKLPNFQILCDKLNFESCGQLTIMDNLIAGVSAIHDCINSLTLCDEMMTVISCNPECINCPNDLLSLLERARAGCEAYQASAQGILGELRQMQIRELKKIFIVPVPTVIKQAYTLETDSDRTMLLLRLTVARKQLRPQTRRIRGAYLSQINDKLCEREQDWGELNATAQQIMTDLRYILH